MLATVIIPTYNVCELLEGCLLSLNHQILTGRQSFDVIVVDDGSTDDTASMVRRLDLNYQLQYHYMPRTSHSSRSAARNLAIANAKGDVIVIVDADQIMPPTFLYEHLRLHAESHDLVVVGPRDFMNQGRVNVERLAQGFDSQVMPPVGRRDSRGQILAAVSENFNNMATCWHYLFTCNASIWRTHLLAVGGFDENFKGWGLEDSELGYRLRKLGLAFEYNSEAVLYHPFRPSFRQLTAELKNERYNQWRANLKYFVQKYDDAEVSAQFILDRYHNPRAADLDFLNACLRFEFAVRALQGRLPLVPADLGHIINNDI
ncbi:MAG TPA: glycosyltransferase [Streptosporangiaceae bacterium]